MSKYIFPEGFLWGVATSSYQIEGAVKEGGRGESIWDRFCQMPGNVLHGDNGDEADDHYHRMKEDVHLMKELGLKAYRFSFSWPRIFPEGVGRVNQEGIQFYSDLIDELLAVGIEPVATIYHWDLPQALQDTGGWQNEEIVGCFEDYCRILFDNYGDRIGKWITINEPYCISFLGNYTGEHAPGIRDLGTALRVSYHLLQAHGAAVRLFRKMEIKGEIGITLNLTPTVSETEEPRDKMAARYQDGFNNRWFLDPVLKGTFPPDMVQLFQSRGITLPDLSKSSSICEKIDFLGVNYYFTSCIRYDKEAWPLYAKEVPSKLPCTERGWTIDPQGFFAILVRLKNEYLALPIYITENGISCKDVPDQSGRIDDGERIDFMKKHLLAVHEALSFGVEIRGYFLWSLYDNFEWAFGHYSRFGIVFQDFETHERVPKNSAYWYQDVIEKNSLEIGDTEGKGGEKSE